MKLIFSFAVVACRHFSTRSVSFEKKKASKFFFFRNKKRPGGFGPVPKPSPKPRIKWTDEQQRILDATCCGQSVFITGSAGTGKTFLLEHIIKRLRKIHGRSKVYVTAPTGVAACALQGQTLHSFAGVGLGELDRHHLLDRVLLDRNACYRWKKVKALIIDEISMVEPNLFDSLEHVARALRSQDEPDVENRIWGGIQLIVSGDFFQLPPVLKKNKKKGSKEYVFEADCWSSSFYLQIELTRVFRQSESLLIQLLQGIRKGETNPEDLKFLEGCCSGFDLDPEAVRLYPRIADVSNVNKEKLKSLGNKVYVYRAQDVGDECWMRQLRSGIAPDELELCVGARVMLIKNMNPWKKLVNGATGTVLKLCEVSESKYDLEDICLQGCVLPLVKFDSGLELVVEPQNWVVMEGDRVVAKRTQVPLILSWALSIHKCQGMTLDKLHADLSRVFDFGMVYVALSRVRSLGGLYLSGLDPSKIKAHPKVLKFYNGFTSGQIEKENEKSIGGDSLKSEKTI